MEPSAAPATWDDPLVRWNDPRYAWDGTWLGEYTGTEPGQPDETTLGGIHCLELPRMMYEGNLSSAGVASSDVIGPSDQGVQPGIQPSAGEGSGSLSTDSVQTALPDGDANGSSSVPAGSPGVGVDADGADGEGSAPALDSVPATDPWNSIFTYDDGSFATHDGETWESLQDNNTNHEPEEGVWWTQLSDADITATYAEDYGEIIIGAGTYYSGEPAFVGASSGEEYSEAIDMWGDWDDYGWTFFCNAADLAAYLYDAGHTYGLNDKTHDGVDAWKSKQANNVGHPLVEGAWWTLSGPLYYNHYGTGYYYYRTTNTPHSVTLFPVLGTRHLTHSEIKVSNPVHVHALYGGGGNGWSFQPTYMGEKYRTLEMPSGGGTLVVVTWGIGEDQYEKTPYVSASVPTPPYWDDSAIAVWDGYNHKRHYYDASTCMIGVTLYQLSEALPEYLHIKSNSNPSNNLYAAAFTVQGITWSDIAPYATFGTTATDNDNQADGQAEASVTHTPTNDSEHTHTVTAEFDDHTTAKLTVVPVLRAK